MEAAQTKHEAAIENDASCKATLKETKSNYFQAYPEQAREAEQREAVAREPADAIGEAAEAESEQAESDSGKWVGKHMTTQWGPAAKKQPRNRKE